MPKRTQASVELNNINIIKFKDINYNRNSYFNESIEKFISRISFDNEEWKYYNNKFESITKAAKFVNVSISSISAALTGKSKTCKNFIWKYDAIER